MNNLRTELAPIADVDTDPTVEALLPSTPALRRSFASDPLPLTDGRELDRGDDSHKLPQGSAPPPAQGRGDGRRSSVVVALEEELLGARGKMGALKRPSAAEPSDRAKKIMRRPAAAATNGRLRPSTMPGPITPGTAGTAPSSKTNFTTYYKGIKINVQVVQKAYRVFLNPGSLSDWKVPFGADKDAAWARVVARIKSL